MEAPHLKITPGHYANIGEKETLFKDREPSKTIPYSAARTSIAHIGEYLPPPGGLSLHQGSTESRKSLQQRFIFQIGTLNPHGINERFSFN